MIFIDDYYTDNDLKIKIIWFLSIELNEISKVKIQKTIWWYVYLYADIIVRTNINIINKR